MKKLILIVLLFTGFQSSAGPIIVGQGTGQSEYTLIFARTNLPELLRSCLNVCALSSEQTSVLKTLIDQAGNPPVAIFKTSSELESQVYRLNLDNREVWFNQDELWLDVARTVAFDIPNATRLWVDILGAANLPTGNRKHLEHIKNELALILSQRFIRIPGLMVGEPVLEALVWKSDVQDKFFIRNSEFENYDFTPVIQGFLGCAQGTTPTQLRINGTRWTLLTREFDEGRLRVRLDTVLTWRCGEVGQRTRAMIVMMAEPLSSGAFRIQADTVQIFEQGE